MSSDNKAKPILIKRSVVESVLCYFRDLHPREGVLLLRGKAKRDTIVIDEVEVPPLAVHGLRFSNFPLHRLPIDFSVVGTAHSHPSGFLCPSVGDLNNFYGRVMLIASYPYDSERHVAIFGRDGEALNYEIIDSDEEENF